MTHRKAIQLTSKPSSVVGSGQVQTELACGLGCVRCGGGVILFQALVGNVGTCRFDVKGELRRRSPQTEKSTNARHRGGTARSSDEAIERLWSKGAVSFQSGSLVNPKGEEPVSSAKAFEIPRALIWQAYQDVKRSSGGPGGDGQTMEDFEVDLKNELYKIWNRMSSGSYFPPPVLRVEIPKADGVSRQLGISTISDRIAQATVKRYLEPLVEPLFHEDSYGYRPGRSALDA